MSKTLGNEIRFIGVLIGAIAAPAGLFLLASALYFGLPTPDAKSPAIACGMALIGMALPPLAVLGGFAGAIVVEINLLILRLLVRVGPPCIGKATH